MSTAPRRPVAWRIHAADAALFAAERKHCETRRCRNPITVATWRYYRSTEAGRVLMAERFDGDQHGAEFAQRHHIAVDPPPDVPSWSRGQRNHPQQGSPS